MTSLISVVVVVLALLTTCKCSTLCQGGAISQTEAEGQILALINGYRLSLLKGEQQNGQNASKLPAAKSMNKLVWDCELEKEAMSPTDTNCPETVTSPPTDKALIYMRQYDDYGYEISDMLSEVLGSISIFSLQDVTGDVKYSTEAELQDYANLMRFNATKIGCHMYKCTADAVSSMYCLMDVTSRKHVPHAEMNDALRTKFLDMHNYRRSLLALGKCPKNNGNLLKSAQNMKRMEYNCQLESEAIAHAMTCSTGATGGSTNGMNFYRDSPAGVVTFEAAVQKVVTTWWKVVRQYPGIGMQAMFRQHHVGTPITSFTQMAWATSNRLGCAIVKCEPYYIGVCKYLERGNIVANKVYVPGTVCGHCSGSCVTSMGLCA